MISAFFLVRRGNITIEKDRQRQEFDPDSIVRLAESIKENGLLHPILVRSDLVDEVIVITLVAGERRIRALEQLWIMGIPVRFAKTIVPEDMIPVVDLGRLSAIEAEAIELAENVDRDDLTWQEKASAIARLMALRSAIAIRDNKPTPTIADISLEVRGSGEGYHHEETRKQILVAKHLLDPDVAKAKDFKEGFKVLQRKEEIKRNEARAKELGRVITSASHRLENTEAIGFMQTIPPGLLDVIVTDPPYGMGADEFGNSGGAAPGGAHRYDDGFDLWYRLMEDFAINSFRITKPSAHCYIFCDFDNFPTLKVIMESVDWRVFRTPIIWHKPNGNRIPWPGESPQRKYEICLFAAKGNRPVMRNAPDVVTIPADENLGHQAQKPVGLFQDLLSRSVRPGDQVADFFCGTGPIIPAGHNLKCYVTACDSDPVSYAIAAKRLQELK